MSRLQKSGLVINGWNIFAHPLFIEQLEGLINQVEKLRKKYPRDYKKKNATKRLAAVAKLTLEIIPADPTKREYRQGNTLGEEHKHWFRAKFFQQYRLFFRYHLQSRIIVFAWVNDEKSKRAYGRTKDAYLVFRKMLETGYPPSDWDDLLKEVRFMNCQDQISSLLC